MANEIHELDILYITDATQHVNTTYDLASVPVEGTLDIEVDLTLNIGNATMVTWDAFHEYVMPSVQGCPTTMVDTAIRSACTEFCAKSFIWRQESVRNAIYENTASYVFAPPQYAKVVTPYRVAINGKELKATDLDTLEAEMPNWRDLNPGTPRLYFLENEDTVRLIPVPYEDIEDALTAGVVLKPSRQAPSCPNFIYEDWAEVIAAGALTKLLAMRGKIWAQEALVPYYDKLFRAGISRAKSKSAKSYQRSAAEMLPVNFYSQ